VHDGARGTRYGADWLSTGADSGRRSHNEKAPGVSPGAKITDQGEAPLVSDVEVVQSDAPITVLDTGIM